MASYTPPVLHATADDLSVTDWNGLANDVTFLYQAPAANVYNSVSGTVATSTNTQISLGGIYFLTYGFSVVSNNLVVPLAGIYLVAGNVTFTAGSGIQATYLVKNGTAIAQATGPCNSNGAGYVATTIATCSASDTLGLSAFQSSGTGQNTNNVISQTYLTAVFMGSN